MNPATDPSPPPTVRDVRATAHPSDDARWLSPVDDVATALRELRAGERVRVQSGPLEREIALLDPVPAGHKFSVRPLGAGLRVRKYGEYIGRLTADVSTGRHVHVHNLETCARRSADLSDAWIARAASAPSVDALGAARTSVGESPIWDERARRLWWIDVRDTPAILALDVDTGEERRFAMDKDVGSIVLAGDRRLLAGLRSGFAFFDTASGRVTPIADPEPHLPRNRMNDGKCDPRGRFWCASMNPESGLAEGSLYVLDGARHVRKTLDGFFTPNGIAWSPDGRTMYFSDTRRGLIWACAYDAADGALGERRVFADVGGLPGGPDGATVDVDGCLWSAQFDGACLLRYTPAGRVDRVVRLPVTKPASCAFGGQGFRQLFVTTAMRGLDARERAAQPLAGRVLVLDVAVAGLPPIAYADAGGTEVA